MILFMLYLNALPSVVRWLLVAPLFLVVPCSVAVAQQMPPTLVVTDTVRQLEFNDQIRLVGRTSAHAQSRITSEVTGRVADIDSEEGVLVAAGTPLVSIANERMGFLLTAKEAETRQAELAAGLAETNRIRTLELFGRNLVSESARDSSTAWAGMQAERFRELAAERDRLALDFENCTIRAPYTGYTGRRLVEAGEWVQPGVPVFEMVDLSSVRVTVDLPERYFGHLSTGSTVLVERQGGSEDSFDAIVTGIAASATEETHTFPVIITIPEADGRLGGGMVVRVTLSLDQRFTSLAVDKDAIVRQGQQTLVYTVHEGKAAPIPVITSSYDGAMVAIRAEGLTEGMQVVIRGNERIFPGSPVMVAGEPPPGTPDQSAETGAN
jgi:RND family efflux transporter MFP subunit